MEMNLWIIISNGMITSTKQMVRIRIDMYNYDIELTNPTILICVTKEVSYIVEAIIYDLSCVTIISTCNLEPPVLNTLIH